MLSSASCLYVCVCVCERERERERASSGNTDNNTLLTSHTLVKMGRLPKAPTAVLYVDACIRCSWECPSALATVCVCVCVVEWIYSMNPLLLQKWQMFVSAAIKCSQTFVCACLCACLSQWVWVMFKASDKPDSLDRGPGLCFPVCCFHGSEFDFAGSN